MTLQDDQFGPLIRQKILDSQATPLPRLTSRDVWLPAVANKALAVIGMRRAGKTSFLWQQLAQRHAAGTAREGLLYFSFEDERLAGLRAEHLDLLLQQFYRLHPHWRDAQRATFFLDEIQWVEGWERFVRRLLDSEQVDIFVSGSSAKLLSREIATSMRGRALEAIVTPFSFREALRHAGAEPEQAVGRLAKAERSRLDHALLRYLAEGGFPEAQQLDPRSRHDLLRSYVDVLLLRDVIERHDLGQPQVLRWLVQQLLGNAAGAFSINKFHADLKSRGIAIGKDSLHQMLAHLEDAFLLTSLSLATDSPRRRQVNPRKVYPVDTGLMALFDRSGKANLGHALETAVLHDLLRRGARVDYAITANGFEVDFHATLPDGQTWLVQVCLDATATDTWTREVRALQDAASDWPHARRLLVALDLPLHAATPQGIECHSATDWLLAPP